MKQLTIHIPEGKFQFVLDLLSNLKFIKIDKPSEGFSISERQKELADAELEKIQQDPGYLLEWDEVKGKLKLA